MPELVKTDLQALTDILEHAGLKYGDDFKTWPGEVLEIYGEYSEAAFAFDKDGRCIEVAVGDAAAYDLRDRAITRASRP